MAYCKLVYEGANPVDYIYLAVNDAFAKQTGLTDVVGKRASKVIPGLREADSEVLRIYGRVVTTGTPERFEYFVKALQMWVSLSVYSPVKDHFIAIFDVITERKNLEEGHKLFRALIDQSNDAIEVLDPNTFQLLDVNQRGCLDLGYSREELLSMSIFDINSLIDRPTAMDVLQRLQKSGSIIFETRHRRKDGSEFPVEVSLRYVQLDRDYVLSNVRDITERKQLESALNRSQRQAKICNWQWEIPTNAIIWSDEASRIFSCDPALLPARVDEVEHLLTPESWALVRPAMEQCVTEGVPYECDAELMRPDGTRCLVVCRGDAKRDAKGDVVEIFGTVQDITERKQAENHIQRLNKLFTGLSRCNEAMLRCTSEDELFQRMCQLIVDIGGINMAWIGLIDEASQKVNPVASYGNNTEYLEGIQVSVNPDDPLSGGPIGLAIRENKSQWFKDFGHDPRSAPWHESSARFGWNACAALPICRSGKPVGAMAFYSTDQGWSDEEVRKLLGDMAVNISFALDKLAAEAESQIYQATLAESELRFRSMVEQSIAGTYIIQDGKFTYVNPRFAEIFGYGSADDLIGCDIFSTIAKKDHSIVVENARKRIKGEVANVIYEFTGLCKDGSMIQVGVHGSSATYNGRPAIIGLLQDISEKKRAEEQITRHVKQLGMALMSTVEVVTTLSEMRDPYTAGHERRVAEIAVAIGAELGLDESRQEGLRVAGFLHDIGKITIPSEILSKPGKLSALEYQMIQGHPQAGYDVLKNVEFPWPVAQVALQHHERMDGSGYPQGLKGEAILFEARILAVADVVEAMSSHRPYRPGLGIGKALTEIERGRGTSYDQVVADACLRLFRDNSYAIST